MKEELKPLQSWRWLLPCALLPLLGFLVLGALGGKECIQVLTGIQPFNGAQMALGGLYLCAYMALVLVSPVCLLAAGLIGVWDFYRRRKSGKGEPLRT